MSTPNFNYENRCIVISDDDYDCGNLPVMVDYNCSHRYSQWLIPSGLHAHNIIVTAGYYYGACIDYVPDAEDFLARNIYMEEGEEAEAVMDIMDFFPEADAGYLMARVMEITNAEDLNERDEAIASLASYIEKIEEPKVNKALDDIRDSYGYTEVWRMAIFSNGEAIYEQV